MRVLHFNFSQSKSVFSRKNSPAKTLALAYLGLPMLPCPVLFQFYDHCISTLTKQYVLHEGQNYKTCFRVDVWMPQMSQYSPKPCVHRARNKRKGNYLGSGCYMLHHHRLTQVCLGPINSPLYQISSGPASLSQYRITERILSGMLSGCYAVLPSHHCPGT